jgi:hypothetical protein
VAEYLYPGGAALIYPPLKRQKIGTYPHVTGSSYSPHKKLAHDHGDDYSHTIHQDTKKGNHANSQGIGIQGKMLAFHG